MSAEPREVTAVPVLELSAEQDQAFRAKVEQLQTIESSSRTQRIQCYYQIGRALDEVFQDRQRGEIQFGANAIQRLAVELAADQSTLYRAQEVATRFTQAQIDQICTLQRVSWSHVLEVVRLPSPEQRMEVLSGIPELPPTQQTVAALRARVQEFRTDPAPGAAPGEMVEDGASGPAGAEEAATAQTKQKGGGSRTGTGHGSSPLTPVKRTFKQAEALSGSITNLIIMLKEFDPESEKVAEKVAKELDAAAGVMVEAMAQVAGAMQVIEEYVGQFNYKDSMAARKAMLSQVIPEIQSFLNGEKQAEAQVHEDRKADRAVAAELDAPKAKSRPEAKTARAEARPTVKAGPKPPDNAALRAIVESRRKAALEDLKRRT